jgi:hypothetical protein
MEDSMSESPSSRFVPLLETLEDRSLLTASFSQVGGTLTIVNNGNLGVSDNGSSGTGNVTVFPSLQAPMTFNNVSRIIIQDTGPNDAIAYQLVGNLTGARRVDVDLGTGNDSFIADLGGSLLASTQMLINVTGHNGPDRIQEVVSGNLFDGSSLGFSADGGTGNTQFTSIVTGTLFTNARNVLNINGGPGNNFFAGLVSGPMLTGSSTDWNVNIGPGNDTMIAYLTTQLSVAASLRLNLIGSGSDVINVGADGMVVSPGASLSYALVSGNASSSISDFFHGVLQGTVTQVAVGGDRNDSITQVTLLDPGSTTSNGGVNSFVEGNGGNDSLLNVVRPSSNRQGVSAVLDGGSGFNIGRINRLVHVRNCQVIIHV